MLSFAPVLRPATVYLDPAVMEEALRALVRLPMPVADAAVRGGVPLARAAPVPGLPETDSPLAAQTARQQRRRGGRGLVARPRVLVL